MIRQIRRVYIRFNSTIHSLMMDNFVKRVSHTLCRSRDGYIRVDETTTRSYSLLFLYRLTAAQTYEEMK